MVLYMKQRCLKHNCELATTALGRTWCPKCVGEKITKDVANKIKFPEVRL